jgi:mRNA interferase HigB
MNVISLKKIRDFAKKHADSRDALFSWYYEASAADWKNPQDIKNRYCSSGFLENNIVIFNIKGNKYRVGTHTEYDKKNFKGG